MCWNHFALLGKTVIFLGSGNPPRCTEHVIRVGYYWEICALETQMTTDKAASQTQGLSIEGSLFFCLKDKAIISCYISCPDDFRQAIFEKKSVWCSSQYDVTHACTKRFIRPHAVSTLASACCKKRGA